jgi:tetratricopeptide (TPR) repeat protein
MQVPSYAIKGHLMPFDPPFTLTSQNEASSLRLDSWKEIAAYLGKGERTAKRWESERALPVHRLPGGGRGSVYAYTAELDEWLNSARDEVPETTDETCQSEELSEYAETPESTALLPEMEAAPASAIPASGGSSGWTARRPVFSLIFTSFAVAAVLLFYRHNTGPHGSSTLRSPETRPVPSVAERQIAHELYLRGRFEWEKRTPESLNRALDDFTQSLVHDPDNAQTYVGMADTYNLLREYSQMPQEEAYSRAIAASRKAIELDDSLAEAHRSLAFAEYWGSWDFPSAEKHFQRAIELNPRDPLAHLWFANAFAGPGWYSFCLREVDRAQELDPSSPAILADKGGMLLLAGQTAKGMDLLKQVEHEDPGFLSPHNYLASFYMYSRDWPDYLLESEKTAQLRNDPDLKATTAAAKEGFRKGGERGLLHELYAAQKKLYDQGKMPGVFLAKTCVLMGKKAEAMMLLREDYKKHREYFILIRTDPILAALGNEPEFQELIGNMHFPAPETASVAESGA